MTDSDNTASRSPRAKRAPRAPQVEINITQEIIDVSVRRDSKNCMIAETILATVPNAHHVSVDTSTIRWSDRDKGLRYTYQTPHVARDAIFKFDFGRKVDPFTFILRRAWVSAIRGSKGSKRISVADWEKMKESVKQVRDERKLTWPEIADEIGMGTSALSSKFGPKSASPGPANVDKIEAWIIEQTGEKPAPRIKTQAAKVAGPVRMRGAISPSQAREPELIGGRPAATPANMTTRQFGLRAFDWKIESE